jgi:tetratricopeptide (TPR) repeat protein
MDLLLRRGEDALEAGDFEAAVEHFTALVDHAPDFAEGYHGRASAYYSLNLIGPALDDLRQVLVLEPRQFDAMLGVGVILESLDRPQQAMDAYQRILEIYPRDASALESVERLKLQLEGQVL